MLREDIYLIAVTSQLNSNLASYRSLLQGNPVFERNPCTMKAEYTANIIILGAPASGKKSFIRRVSWYKRTVSLRMAFYTNQCSSLTHSAYSIAKISLQISTIPSPKHPGTAVWPISQASQRSSTLSASRRHLSTPRPKHAA